MLCSSSFPLLKWLATVTSDSSARAAIALRFDPVFQVREQPEDMQKNHRASAPVDGSVRIRSSGS
jgi:hypothetical protein